MLRNAIRFIPEIGDNLKYQAMKKLYALLGLFIISQSLFGQNKTAYVSLSGGQELENGRLHYDYSYFSNLPGCDTLICSNPGYEPGVFQPIGVIESETGLLYQKIFNDAIIAVSDRILTSNDRSGKLELVLYGRTVLVDYSNGQISGEATMYISILD